MKKIVLVSSLLFSPIGRIFPTWAFFCDFPYTKNPFWITRDGKRKKKLCFSYFFRNIASRVDESSFFHFWRVLGSPWWFHKITKISKSQPWDYDFFCCVSCRREAICFKKTRGAYTRTNYLFLADVPKAPTYLPPEMRLTRTKTWF